MTTYLLIADPVTSRLLLASEHVDFLPRPPRLVAPGGPADYNSLIIVLYESYKTLIRVLEDSYTSIIRLL